MHVCFHFVKPVLFLILFRFKKEFWALLEKNVDKPGGLLNDYYTIFLGKPCYTELKDSDRQYVFDDFQRQLKNRLRIDFQELLWERPSVFRNLNLNQNLTEDDLNVIYNSLNDDQRYGYLLLVDLFSFSIFL